MDHVDDAMDPYDANEIMPGDRAGPYRIIGPLPGDSQGGMSQLYEVKVRPGYEEPDWPERLVLKVAKLEYEDHLKEEADYLKRFDHPNVVRIYPLPGRQKDVYMARHQFRVGWRCYYAMEYLPGGSLREWLDAQKRLSVQQAVGITRQLLAALEHIHYHQVVNLDLKPENTLLRQRPGFLSGGVPEVVLCDFGIARDLRRGGMGVMGIGTPQYTTPEQIKEMGRPTNQRVDQRADIFLLGITFFEMLTGELPFENIGFIVKTDELAPYPSQLNRAIPPEMDQIVLRMLSKHTNERYASAREVLLALEGVSLPADWRKRGLWMTLGCLFLLGLGLMAAAAVLLGQALLT